MMSSLEKEQTVRMFQPPARLPGISDIAYTALQLAALSSRLALENRTLVNHITGRAENVAEHSAMLAIVAPAIAEMHYPHLDANLVGRYATIHDAVEAYVGDTATHAIDDEGLQQKAKREAQGLQHLRNDFAALPPFVKLIDQYEAQEKAEARFVRVIDKWTPVLVHFADKGATVRSYTNPQRLVDDYASHAERLRKQFPDFPELVAVREELTRLVAKHLFHDKNTETIRTHV
jgi:5'-deoxynucleotidase YfbR-like HD superfamily hydrolase